MKLLTRPAKPELVRLKFAKVPEIAIDELDYLGDRIALLRLDRRLPSFGAYIVRKAGDEVAKTFVERFRGPNSSTKVGPFTFTADTNPLHRDYGVRNDVTANVTKVNFSDVILLIGSETEEHEINITKKMNDRLFDKRIIDASVVPMPTYPMRATLGPEDMVVFDHTQLHAFAGTGDRLAHAYYE